MPRKKNTTWKFYPRWKIVARLVTETPMHIGSGNVDVNENIVTSDGDPVEINTCIKCDGNQGGNAKPYIPGSTLKGNIRAWVEERVHGPGSRELMKELLGYGSTISEEQRGGRAEFLNAYLSQPVEGDIPLPHWNSDCQTYIETSTVIDRTTKTVAEKKLFHNETVPPGVEFCMEISGAMPKEQVALLVAAIKVGFAKDAVEPITLGADDANDKGRLCWEKLSVFCMEKDDVRCWLQADGEIMAKDAMQPLAENRVSELVKLGRSYLSKGPDSIEIGFDLEFAGPFLVNDPTRVDEETADLRPLLNAKGEPTLPVASFRGALRSQAERIIRTLGGKCCDTASPCQAVYNLEEIEKKLCLACQIFGASGWKSRVRFESFKYVKKESLESSMSQEFVAIDRFTGGGKDKAKFKADYIFRPLFKGKLSIKQDMPDWGKGLLALVLRDLQERDITFGYGASKGYGSVNHASVTGYGNLHGHGEIQSFRNICRLHRNAGATKYSCDTRKIPSAIMADEGNQAARVESGQDCFHNPYHFVPVQTPDTEAWVKKNIDDTTDNCGISSFDKNMHDSHALYRSKNDENEPLYHGRIQCRLITETPIFIGGRKDDSEGDQPPIVNHYTLDLEPAIPATSLRGMIASLAETVSNSSLRVLGNGLLSYRKPVNSQEEKFKALSALGMIVEKGEKLELIPLALPTLEARRNGRFEVPENYRKMFPVGKSAFKTYIKNVCDSSTSYETWTPGGRLYWLPDFVQPGMERHFVQVTNENQNKFKIKNYNSKSVLLGGQCRESELKTSKRKGFVPGILRILGKKGREGDMPKTKKHELFIPIPEEYVKENGSLNIKKFFKDSPSFRIERSAIDQFHQLAEQRTVSQKNKIKRKELSPRQVLPYHLFGTRHDRSSSLENALIQLQQGDIVFFRPDFHGNAVAELSFSSVWRGKVDSNVFDFFPKELRPFNYNRQCISPAEMLFGFVQDDKQIKLSEEEDKEKKLAFAGKVNFSAGCLDNGKREVQGDEVTLKILSSPKLPSPALYFKNNTLTGDGYISKHDLSTLNATAQGRKYYLHALRRSDKPEQVMKISRKGEVGGKNFPWQSYPEFEPKNNRQVEKNARQKVRVRPVKEGIGFTFHVDFTNLSEWELGMLCYSLSPSNAFRHKIGMGKPLGLGTVRIETTKLQLIDRYKRYDRDSLNSERYNSEAMVTFEEVRNLFETTMHPDTRQAIKLLGDPANITRPVHYPQLSNKSIEGNNYEWFVENDKQVKDYLRPLTSDSNALPKLKRRY